MAQRCAYLVKIHNILKELVANIDQTYIHLVFTRGSRTRKIKITKHIKVHGAEDKRQVIITVSSAVNIYYLHFQIIS